MKEIARYTRFSVYSNDREWTVIKPFNSGVVVLGVLPNQRTILVREPRLVDCGNTMPALNAVRGVSESNQTPRENAIREFMEETGIKMSPSDMEFLGICRPDSGSLATHLSIFRAWLGPTHLQSRKGIENKEISTVVLQNSQLFEQMASGLIADAITHQAVLLSQLSPNRRPSQLEVGVKIELPIDKIRIAKETLFEKAQELLYPIGVVYSVKKNIITIDGTGYGTEKQYDDILLWIKSVSLEASSTLTLSLTDKAKERLFRFNQGKTITD